MNGNGVPMSTHWLKQMRVSDAAGHFEWSPLIRLYMEENTAAVLKQGSHVAKMSVFWRKNAEDAEAASCQEKSRNGSGP